jgi:hypothetical protein
MAIHHTPPVVHTRPEARTEARREAPIVRDHRVERPVVRAPIVREQRREPVRWDRDHDRDRGHGRVIVEHPIYQSSVWTASPGYTYVPQPIQLMAPTALSSDSLSLDVSLGGATSLQLSNTGTGSTYVSDVLLVSADGATQTVPVNAILSAQNPTIQLPINSAGITQIVLQGHSDWGGSLALTAV